MNYLLDPSGQFLGGRWNGGGNSAIPLGSRLLAEYMSNGADFDHVNVLGSDTQMTDYAGNGGQAILYYPWGQVWSNPSNLFGNTFYQRYASLQLYDTSTNGYVPPFRYYVSNQGRWLTPDPLAGDITNPQSLNRYAYVRNNPTSRIDPLGLCQTDPSKHGPGTGCIPDDVSFALQGTTPLVEALGTRGGYDYFDALSGAPGTYLTTDQRGNWGFGFSPQLWAQTWNLIDSERKEFAAGGTDPSLVPTSGFQVSVTNRGLDTETAGLIPEMQAFSEERRQLADILSGSEGLGFYDQLVRLRGGGDLVEADVLASIMGFAQRFLPLSYGWNQVGQYYQTYDERYANFHDYWVSFWWQNVQ